MSCWIGFGKLSSLYLYILYSITFKSLNDFILSFESIIKLDEDKGIFWISPELKNHILIQSLYKYISFILFGFIFLYCSKEKTKKKKKRKNDLIDNKKKKYISNTTIFYLFLICLLYVFYLELIKISYPLGFHDCDLWIFNILFILIFISHFYSINHYKHQKYSLYFIFSINLIIISLKSFLPENNVYNTTTVELFKDSLYSILIILIYIMNSFLVSFSRVLGKVLMELNYISPYSIIVLIGILGLILTSILLALSSIFSCEGKTIKRKCNVYDKNKPNINNESYFDSIPIYFYNLKIILDDASNSYKFYIEILLLTPIYLFTNFMEFNYEILLIYYLNPTYILLF